MYRNLLFGYFPDSFGKDVYKWSQGIRTWLDNRLIKLQLLTSPPLYIAITTYLNIYFI